MLYLAWFQISLCDVSLSLTAFLQSMYILLHCFIDKTGAVIYLCFCYSFGVEVILFELKRFKIFFVRISYRIMSL